MPPPAPHFCATHLPAIPKRSLSGPEQLLRVLQVILGKAIEVATEPTHVAPIGARHSHLHLGPPIPQHLYREAGTGAQEKARGPRKPRAHPSGVSACPLQEGRRNDSWSASWKGGLFWPRPGRHLRRAPSPFIIPELGFPVKCNPLSEIHSLTGIQALQRTNHK